MGLRRVHDAVEQPWTGCPGDYARYYYGSVENGRRLLIGTFIRDDRHPGIRVTTKGKVPRVFDGGCYQINVIYDVDAKQTVLIRCNGVA